MIDRVLPIRVRGERVLVRVQQQTRADGGPGRVLLKGPPEALRLLEGYTFAEDARAVTLSDVQLAPPPDGGDAWLAFAEAHLAPTDRTPADSPSDSGPVRSG